MVVIGINLSQTTDIITLISDFVGVTIVTKSDELIADILQLDDEDPNFLNNVSITYRTVETTGNAPGSSTCIRYLSS
jgi:hypothetical protein